MSLCLNCWSVSQSGVGLSLCLKFWYVCQYGVGLSLYFFPQSLCQCLQLFLCLNVCLCLCLAMTLVFLSVSMPLLLSTCLSLSLLCLGLSCICLSPVACLSVWPSSLPLIVSLYRCLPVGLCLCIPELHRIATVFNTATSDNAIR